MSIAKATKKFVRDYKAFGHDVKGALKRRASKARRALDRAIIAESSEG